MISLLLRLGTAAATILSLCMLLFPSTFATTPNKVRATVALLALAGTLLVEVSRRAYFFPESSVTVFPTALLPEERVPTMAKIRYDIGVPADEVREGARVVYWSRENPASDAGVSIVRNGVVQVTVREEASQICLREIGPGQLLGAVVRVRI